MSTLYTHYSIPKCTESGAEKNEIKFNINWMKSLIHIVVGCWFNAHAQNAVTSLNMPAMFFFHPLFRFSSAFIHGSHTRKWRNIEKDKNWIELTRAWRWRAKEKQKWNRKRFKQKDHRYVSNALKINCRIELERILYSNCPNCMEFEDLALIWYNGKRHSAFFSLILSSKSVATMKQSVSSLKLRKNLQFKNCVKNFRYSIFLFFWFDFPFRSIRFRNDS